MIALIISTQAADAGKGQRASKGALMKPKIILPIVIAAMTVACSHHKPGFPRSETTECQRWRTMITAPMPPDVHARLKAECDKSVHGPRHSAGYPEVQTSR